MKYSIFILLSFVLIACSKEIKNNKILHGTWKPAKSSVFDHNGLRHDVSSNGTLTYKKDGKRSKSGSYIFELDLDFNGTPIYFHEKGRYSIENNNIITFVSTTADTSKATIVYRTKGDMILEFPNKQSKGFNFVLKKQ